MSRGLGPDGPGPRQPVVLGSLRNSVAQLSQSQWSLGLATPLLALTNPSCLWPGRAWTLGSGRKVTWCWRASGVGEGARQPQHLPPASPWLSLSCCSSGPWAWTAHQEALGTGCKGNPATALPLPAATCVASPSQASAFQPGSCSLRSCSQALGPGFAPMPRRGPPNAHSACLVWIPCMGLKTILHQNKIVFRFHFPRLWRPLTCSCFSLTVGTLSAHALWLSGSPKRGTSSSKAAAAQPIPAEVE